MSKTLKVVSAIFLALLVLCILGVVYLEYESHNVKTYAGDFCQAVKANQNLEFVLGHIQTHEFHRAYFDETSGKHWVLLPSKELERDLSGFFNGRITILFKTKSPTTYSCVIEVHSGRTTKANLVGEDS